MSLNPTTTKYGGGDMEWLGSRHGVANARTITLSAKDFPDALKNDHVVPAGTPVEAGEDGLYKPFGEGTLAGFTMNTVSVKAGNEPVAMIDHGRVNVDKLPVEKFKAPAHSAFVFLGVKAEEGIG